MRRYDSPRDYKTALGPSWGSGTVRQFPQSATPGLSSVTLSAHLLMVLSRTRRREREDSDEDPISESVRRLEGQAAA